MNPVFLTILIVKVALCTILLVTGLRLLFLSKEAFINFVGHLLGIADLEISHSTYITVKVIGVLLVAASIGLACLFFWPEPVEPVKTALSLMQNTFPQA